MVDQIRPEHPVVPHRVPPTRSQIFAQIVVSLVILGSGIGIGAGGTIFALKERIAPPPLPPRPEITGMVEGLVRQWSRELSLTDEQAQQIRALLTADETARRKQREQMRKEETDRQQDFVKSMQKILTAKQFQKWQDDFRERVEYFQRRWPGRPDDGRGGPGGRRGMRGGPGFDPNHPQEFMRGGPQGFDPNRPMEFRRDRSRGFDPNRPPDFRGRPRGDFDPNRPPQFMRERSPEFGPGQPPGPNQPGQRP